MNKVLIVDDEKNIQVSLASILEDEGYKVFFAQNGEEGLEKFRNISPDAIFLDIWLPGMDGVEVMRQILAEDPSKIVIMMSGHGSIAAAVSAMKAGAYDFLEKPLSLDKVIFALKRGLEYRQVLEENRKLKAILGQCGEPLSAAEAKKIVRGNTGVIEWDARDTSAVRPQKTVATSNICYGIGLHSGEKTGLAIQPLPPGKGIRFENISEEGYIPASIRYLDSTGYATSIRKDRLVAHTIEHLMAVLHAFGITNLAVKITKEVPILDGSASGFCDFIQESGIVEQDAVIPDLVVDQTFQLGEEGPNEKFMRVEPYPGFAVRYTCIYPLPLGSQTYEFVMTGPDDFLRDIAPARTYGFMDELNKLADMGLAEGGRFNNVILIDRDRIINTQLRFPEELARHKILDIMGDFYLLGRGIRARITAQKTGHGDNAAMVRLLHDHYLSPG